MRAPTWQVGVPGRHQLWRGEENARAEARKYLDAHQIAMSDDDIAMLISAVYPPIANGALSKAMLLMRDLGDRRHVHETLEALDLIRRRWSGYSARSRP